MDKIDTAIRNFAQFINKSWDFVMPFLENRDYTTNESSIADWLQANWEILVERKVLEIDQYLEVYGDGVDFNGRSSRITVPDALPNYSVTISSDGKVLDLLNNEKVLLNRVAFIEFVSFKDGFYRKEPQFDYVLLEDDLGKERVVSINDIEFELTETKG